MTNEPPTLDTYEKMAGVEFDLEETDLEEEEINDDLESIFTSQE